MPTFTFEGFTEGSLVALSAAQGAQGAAGSVQEWRLSNLNTATIDISTDTHAEIVAPAGIWFEATGFGGFAVEEVLAPRAYDPSAHDLTLLWDFNDPGAFETALNIPVAWNDKGVDFGKKAYHVFEAPGTYAVQLRGIDRENTMGERTVSVTVQDPTQVYSGVRTICVSRNSDFTGAPAGAQQVTSLAAARSALAALNQTGRILLRRGETFDETFPISNDLANVHIGAFGAGAKPVWQTTGRTLVTADFNDPNPTSIVFWGIRFEGEWDAAKETGDPRGVPFFFNGYNVQQDWHATIYQCEFDGLSSVIFQTNGTRYIAGLVDCDITNWQDYGVANFGGPEQVPARMAIVGSAVHQKENAATASQAGKVGLANDHGPVRIGSAIEALISCSDFYSANQWFLGDGSPQPCLRLFSSGDGNPGGYFTNVNRVVCEGGGEGIVKLDGQNGGTPERPGNHVFDMMLLVGDYSTRRVMQLAYGGTTVRNVLGIIPNTAARQGGEVGFWTHPNDNNTAENQASVMRIYNCTSLNLYADAGYTESDGSENFTNRTLQNCVHHQPNLATPVVPDAPVDLSQTIAGFTPRNRGKRVGVEKVSTSISGVGNGQSFTVGYPSGTSAGDFSPGGRHTVKVGDNYYFSYRGDCALSFGGSNITVTNTSGQTWSGTARLGLDQDTLSTQTQFGTPAVPLPLPVPVGARSADGPLQAERQFDTGPRVRALGAV